MLNEQTFDFQFLTVVYALGDGEAENHKFEMVFVCTLVCYCVSLLIYVVDNLQINNHKNIGLILKYEKLQWKQPY